MASLDNIRQLLRSAKRADWIKSGQKRAAVACIMRKARGSLPSRSPPSSSPSPSPSPSLSSSLAISNTIEDPLEMFFILRSSTVAPGSTGRFAGHVAFPGGHAEGNETDFEAAVRETKEEVGLDIADETRFKYVGRITDRVITRTRDDGDESWTLAVSCLLFEQMCVVTSVVPSRIQASEVTACGWAPLSSLTSNEFARAYKPNIAPIPLDTIFGSVQLPMNDITLCVDAQIDEETALSKFRLWGLTLSMINDLMITCMLRKDGITSEMFRSNNTTSNSDNNNNHTNYNNNNNDNNSGSNNNNNTSDNTNVNNDDDDYNYSDDNNNNVTRDTVADLTSKL